MFLFENVVVNVAIVVSAATIGYSNIFQVLQYVWIFVQTGGTEYTLSVKVTPITAQKMKFSMKGFFSKYDQIRSFLRIWSHVLKKSLMENFIFCAVNAASAMADIRQKCYSLEFWLYLNPRQ